MTTESIPPAPSKALTPKEFKAEMATRLWTYQALAARWSISENWLRKLAGDESRPPHWDDAVRGLPLADNYAGLTTDRIKKIKDKLQSTPPASNLNRPITVKEAVRLLAKDIQSLQARGYTIKQIAEHLNTLGMPITAATLSSFLSRAKKNDVSDPETNLEHKEE